MPYVFVGNKTESSAPKNYNFNNEVRQQNYVANSGASIDISSSIEVILLPNVDINNGLYYRAHIGLACSTYGGTSGARGVTPSLSDVQDDDNSNLNMDKDIKEKELEFNIIPNPSSGNYNLTLNNAGQYPTSINVINLLGKSVYQNNRPNAYEVDFDITEAPNGLYIVEVNYDGKIISKKIIKN